MSSPESTANSLLSLVWQWHSKHWAHHLQLGHRLHRWGSDGLGLLGQRRQRKSNLLLCRNSNLMRHIPMSLQRWGSDGVDLQGQRLHRKSTLMR